MSESPESADVAEDGIYLDDALEIAMGIVNTIAICVAFATPATTLRVPMGVVWSSYDISGPRNPVNPVWV